MVHFCRKFFPVHWELEAYERFYCTWEYISMKTLATSWFICWILCAKYETRDRVYDSVVFRFIRKVFRLIIALQSWNLYRKSNTFAHHLNRTKVSVETEVGIKSFQIIYDNNKLWIPSFVLLTISNDFLFENFSLHFFF